MLHLREETVNLPRISTSNLPEELLSSDIYELRPIFSGRLFFYIIMTINNIILQPPQSQLLPSLKSIIEYGRISDISVSQLSPAALWLLTSFIKFGDSSALTTRQKKNVTDGVSYTNSEKRTRATRFRNTHAKPTDTADSDGNSDDSHYSIDELDDDDDDNDGQDGDLDAEKGWGHRRWEPLEEQRLLAWNKEGKPWKWIFKQLPSRTEGAVRVRFHMLKHRENVARVGSPK